MVLHNLLRYQSHAGQSIVIMKTSKPNFTLEQRENSKGKLLSFHNILKIRLQNLLNETTCIPLDEHFTVKATTTTIITIKYVGL